MQPGFALAGRYVLERLLGQGAVGEVWRASDRELDRLVAVKVIGERIADPKLAEGFQREARIAGRLQHPGITVVHDVGEHEGQPYIVMELLVGRDLEAVLATRPGGLPVDEAVSLAIQAADALAAAHAGGVVHRDLKPANLFLQDSGQLKICDFGIAVATETTGSLALLSYLVGTPAYMSPEQCDGREAGEPGDVYSLGCVLYALLAGRPPFMSGPPLAIMAQHRTAAPAALHALRPAVPVGLDRLVTDLLAKDPATRPVGAAQVAAALRALQGELGAVGASEAPEHPANAPGGDQQAFDPARPRASSAAVGPVAVTTRQLLATAGDDRTVRVWDPATGRHVVVLRGPRHGIDAMCPVIVHGRPLLATASIRTVRVWDLATGHQIATLQVYENRINELCPVTVYGRQLLAIASDHTVRVWDPSTGPRGVVVMRGHRGRASTVCSVTIGGRLLVAAGGSDGMVRLWDPATGQQAATMERPQVSGTAIPYAVTRMCSIAARGRLFLVVGGSDGTVRAWDPATGQQVAVLRAHPGLPGRPARVTAICSVSLGGHPFVATGGSDGSVHLWDPVAARQTAMTQGNPQWPASPPGSVSGICSVIAGGRPILAAGGSDGTVRFWDLATGEQAAALHGHRDQVNALCPVTVSSAQPLATAIGTDDRAARSWIRRQATRHRSEEATRPWPDKPPGPDKPTWLVR